MATVHPVSLSTVDGLTLDGDLALPAEPWAAAVIAHPHPPSGGDRHSPVVAAVFRRLAAAGVAVVRFDFRGVGDSEGEHDDGQGERVDVVAALDLAADVVARESLGAAVLVGYSFGGRVVLDVTDERVAGWCAIAGAGRAVLLAGADHRPKLLLVPAHDQYAAPSVVADLTADWRNTTRVTIPMADHFLAGALERVADDVLGFVRSLVVR